MIVGFVIWSIVAVIFLGISISCRKSHDAVGFFTFAEPPTVTNIERYNRAVSRLWFVGVIVLEIIGIPILFMKQNSPLFILIVLGVMVLVISMMIAYTRIEAKYRK